MKKSAFFLSLFLLSGTGFGQSAEIDQSFHDLRELQVKRKGETRLLTAKREKPYTKEEIKKIKAMLEPNPADLARYKGFLQKENTGLFRLFPHFNCASGNTIRVDGGCENFIPGSSEYSFRLKDYPDYTFYDLFYANGNLISNGFFSQGIIVSLGDVPIEDISLTSSGIKFLIDFKPEVQSQDVKKQFLEISKGITSDGFRYSNFVKAAENTTYALRVIAYKSKDKVEAKMSSDKKNIITNGNILINYLETDKRVDLTLVFRVIRKEADGNISILWKELQRQDAPRILFEKGEDLSDIKENLAKVK